jgi:hypothetical protein
MIMGTSAARSGASGVRNLGDHLPTIVMTACLTDVVRQLELAAVRTFTQVDGTKAMV